MPKPNLEGKLKDAVGKKVRVNVKMVGEDAYTFAGRLLEVTEEYLKLEGLGVIYINRRITTIVFFEIYE